MEARTPEHPHGRDEVLGDFNEANNGEHRTIRVKYPWNETLVWTAKGRGGLDSDMNENFQLAVIGTGSGGSEESYSLARPPIR